MNKNIGSVESADAVRFERREAEKRARSNGPSGPNGPSGHNGPNGPNGPIRNGPRINLTAAFEESVLRAP